MSDETTETDETKPRLSEAIQDLDGFEICGIEDYWGRDLGDLTGTTLTLSLLWARKRREGMKTADAWQAVKRMKLGEMDNSFAPEPKDQADQPLTHCPVCGWESGTDDEESPRDMGKDDSETRGPARSSASARGSRRKSSPA